MVLLVSQNKLNQLSIDSVERALVLSTLALRLAIAASGNPDNLIDKVKLKTVNSGKSNINLQLDLLLPLDADIFSDKGGLIMQSTKELPTDLTSLVGKLNFTVTPSSESSPVIPTYDESLVATFEKYFVFNALILLASLTENRNEIITLTPQTNNLDGAELKIKVILPLDPIKYATGSNFIDSVKRVATSYVDSLNFTDIDSQTSLLGNNSQIENNSLIGN